MCDSTDLNAFEHQRFLLRRPDGARLRKSFREIVTEPNAAYALDYPQEFFNVAALGLMAYLAQVAFEPEDVAELADRVREPLTDAQFEAKVAPLRPHFCLTGDGPRFMQGPSIAKKGKLRPIASLLWHVPSAPTLPSQDNKQFLFRPLLEWAVEVEQAALLCFAFNTFFPGYLGGHKWGVNGYMAVRTIVVDRSFPRESKGSLSQSGSINVRRSIWTNVLARDVQQTHYEGDFPHQADRDAYNAFFWEEPPEQDVEVSKI